MAKVLINTRVEVRLLSLLDLGQFELSPQPVSIAEAEYFRLMFSKVPKLLNLARQVHWHAIHNNLAGHEQALAELAEEACRGL